MVEECQVDGAADCGGYLLDISVCGLWVWVAGLEQVCWKGLEEKRKFTGERRLRCMILAYWDDIGVMRVAGR